MEIQITSFDNPFSFFCVNADPIKSAPAKVSATVPGYTNVHKTNILTSTHGKYVAVLWNQTWVRGIVNMEDQFLVWLIDYGKHIKASEIPTFIELPPEYKKIPTKVFEASVHGVMPIDKILSEDCEIKDNISDTWTPAAISKAQELIKKANKIHFMPIALLTTHCNHIVIGDLYLQLPEKGIVNLVDELEQWPVFLCKNKPLYIEKLSALYTTRRRHRACILKPDIPDLAQLSVPATLAEYNAICDPVPAFEPAPDVETVLSDGSSVLVNRRKRQEDFKLTPEEIEQFSNMYVKIAGREYNLLNIIKDKTRDLIMCERYKDHDLKGVGRGYTYKKP